jgi:L-rhamnose-H+ transport protein
MQENVILGLGFAVIAGVFAGSFSLPMKFTTQWKWQHNWILWAIWGTLIMPIILAFLTVPHLTSIYHSVDVLISLKVVLFGMAWGLGAICFGLGLEYLGVALGMSIMIGLIISIGTLIPIILYQPSELTTPKGHKIIIAAVILTIGIITCAIAGSIRDKKTKSGKNHRNSINQATFKKGLLIAIIAGVISPMQNLGYISGKPLQEAAIQSGSNPSFAGNAVWPLVMFGGFIVNFSYCAYLIQKDHEWNLFATKKKWYWLALASSGMVWFFCMMFFGMASSKLGKLGSSIGWASFQSIAVITGNLVGLSTGEWKNSGSMPKFINFIGIILLMIGILVIAF